MSKSNPIIRAIQNSRATPGEKLEAWEALAHDDDVSRALGGKIESEKANSLVAIVETVEDATRIASRHDGIVGLSTGYGSIDKLTGGIGPSEIVVVFGDTSHGKSQLAQNITLNVALRDEPVLFVGLEMSNAENTVRFLTMAQDKARAADSPIFYPTSTDIGYRDIDRLVGIGKENGAVVVVIDHLHMFARDVTNLPNEISLICHEFKRVARKYEIPMIVISHINRGGTGKGIPELRDLKGSGSIEQDADIALAVWRDMNLDERDQVLKVVLRKNRLRGRKHTEARLAILDNARLAEVIDTRPFPTKPS